MSEDVVITHQAPKPRVPGRDEPALKVEVPSISWVYSSGHPRKLRPCVSMGIMCCSERWSCLRTDQPAPEVMWVRGQEWTWVTMTAFLEPVLHENKETHTSGTSHRTDYSLETRLPHTVFNSR